MTGISPGHQKTGNGYQKAIVEALGDRACDTSALERHASCCRGDSTLGASGATMTTRGSGVEDYPDLVNLLSVLSDGVLATDANGVRVYSNLTLDRFVGTDATTPRASTAPPAFMEESRDLYTTHIEMSMRGLLTERVAVGDVRLIGADGESIDVPASLVPVTSSSGRTVGMLWVFHLREGPAASRARQLERTLTAIAEEINRAGCDPTTGATPETAWELSPRETEVYGMLLLGHRVSTMADALCLSEHTVRNHLKSIFRKAGVHSQAELIEIARNGGVG